MKVSSPKTNLFFPWPRTDVPPNFTEVALDVLLLKTQTNNGLNTVRDEDGICGMSNWRQQHELL